MHILIMMNGNDEFLSGRFAYGCFPMDILENKHGRMRDGAVSKIMVHIVM